MREILFKAKQCDTGEWVEGWYYQETDGGMHNLSYIAAFKKGYNGEMFLTGCYEVDPDTVCEYTGLTDKNGKKIFEEDYLFDGKLKYLVKYSSTSCGFEAHGFIREGIWSLYHLCNKHNQGREIEVIGNIFDNPELIGGKTE